MPGIAETSERIDETNNSRDSGPKGTTETLKEEKIPSTGKRVRYNLNLSEQLYNELQEVADRRDITVLELLRKAIKLILLAAKLEDTPGAALIIREGDREREIVLL